MAKDNEHQNDEHWLKVLAGDIVADDGDSRQAEALRQYFTQRAAIEFDAPQDPERTKRMLNHLEARGAFQAIKPSVRQRSQEETTWLGRFRTWLLPPGGGHAGRFALVATLTLAVLAVPVLRGILTEPQDDVGEYKAAPSSAHEATILAVSPPQEALQLQALLARYGVGADIASQGDDRIVTAAIPQGVRDAVRAELARQGIPGPQDGELKIRIQPFPK